MTQDVLVVDRKGLARKVAHKPKEFLVYELLQNAWDENVSKVEVEMEMLPGKPVCRIRVTDDAPDGFADLRSIYTLFRDSKKASDPTKRGRFELGEKLVIALCQRAVIISTKGSVSIDGDTRTSGRMRTDKGTVFDGEFKLTRADMEHVLDRVRNVIPPKGITTKINGESLVEREPLHTFQVALQTVRSDDEGNLKPTKRVTFVEVYDKLEERACIYEMGLPVVETDDQWHYNVLQRVPVNWERDNVPPSYLRTLRVSVVNAMSETDALTAMSQGYTVVHGGSLPAAAWDNVRRSEALLPAGQVTPSPRVYDPNGRPESVLPKSQWTPAMHERAQFIGRLSFELLEGCSVCTRIVQEPAVRWSANYGKGMGLCLNLSKLGHEWFSNEHRDELVLELLLHEFAHHYSLDHLSSKYHEALSRLGAKIAALVWEHSEVLDRETYR